MYYVLRLKTTTERIDRIKSDSIENAKTFFISRKQMDEESFDNLFYVEQE